MHCHDDNPRSWSIAADIRWGMWMGVRQFPHYPSYRSRPMRVPWWFFCIPLVMEAVKGNVCCALYRVETHYDLSQPMYFLPHVWPHMERELCHCGFLEMPTRAILTGVFTGRLLGELKPSGISASCWYINMQRASLGSRVSHRPPLARLTARMVVVTKEPGKKMIQDASWMYERPSMVRGMRAMISSMRRATFCVTGMPETVGLLRSPCSN